MVYNYDVIIFLFGLKYHILYFRNILDLLKQVDPTLNLKNFALFTETFDYFWRAILTGRLQLAPHTMYFIRYIQKQTVITELTQFLGPWKDYQTIVPDFTPIATLLY